MGLVERVSAVAPAAELTVVPDLRGGARACTSGSTASPCAASATRISARLGKGREFDRLREYVPGDEFRDIAWKASARHGKLIVREYRLDRSQDVLLLPRLRPPHGSARGRA